MHRPLKAICAVAAGLLVAGTVASAGNATPSTDIAAAPALPTNWYAAAPYLMPADNNPPDPAEIMDATGQKAFQLAFILSDGGCNPAWDGKTPIDDAASIDTAVNTIRGKGGDVSVSVGGYNGTKLGQSCSDAASTAAAYQKVITKYGLHAIDFDLEEPEYENTQAIANELGAAKILQQDNDGLYVSVTMPGTAAGTGWFGTQLLDQAKTIGFTPANFSIMPFDGGFGGGGASQTAALEAFHGLLVQHLGWDSDFAYQHEGVSGMNGRTDAAEYFTQADFQTVLDYALAHKLGRYTYWSANRDRECDPPDNQQLSGECSSVAQQPWEFTTYTTKFAEQTTVVNPSITPATVTGTPAYQTVSARTGSTAHQTVAAKTATDDGKSGYINGSGDGNKRIIYFDQWSIYQNAYYLKDLDKYADNLDYILYDFANIEPTNLTCFETTKATVPDPGGETDPNAGDGAGDQFADYEKTFDASTSVDGQADAYGQPIAGNFNQILKLKARHPNLKVLLSIGGWTYSKYFSDAAASDASRQKFAGSCLDMFIRGDLPKSPGGYGGPGTGKGLFDGIDVDWEYPASDTGHVGNHTSPNDTANYTALLAEFRSELDAQGASDGKTYALSAALPGGQDKVAKIETDKIGQYLDFGNAMTYDMHGAWDATGPTNLQDPLFPSPDDPSTPIPGGTQQYDTDTILKAFTVGDPEYGIPGGFPAEKLTLGIPMYYRGWTGVPAGDKNGLYGSATGPSAPQPLSGNVPGVALQKELASLGLYPGKEYYDSQRMAGWYYDGTTFYAGSTPQSIVDHVAYAKCNGLGGMMVFSAYDETSASQPLLEKILSEADKSKPADCAKYATDTWGDYGPPASSAATASRAPGSVAATPGGAGPGAGSYAPPAPVVEPRTRH